MKLTAKKALITGGNSGIGLATARLFIAEGAQVAITGRDQKTLDEAIAELGSSARGYRVDVTIAEDRKRLFAALAPKISGSSTSSSPMPASPAGLLPARPTRPFLRT
jgi:NAD(P)-dependent dehydrogenase (short-subunit alcohol dehydrogenase family)